MILYPAIDLINKECVRLKKGDYSQKTVFNKDPVKQAQNFENEGPRYLRTLMVYVSDIWKYRYTALM